MDEMTVMFDSSNAEGETHTLVEIQGYQTKIAKTERQGD